MKQLWDKGRRPSGLRTRRPVCGAKVRLTVACCSSALVLLCAAPAASQHVVPDLWGTDGNVVAIARSGNTIYIGGAFTMVGPNTGSGVPLNAATGEAIAPFPHVAGGPEGSLTVRAVIPDGNGGWFIGGSFVTVGGHLRSNLAHILPGGEVAGWNPGPDGDVLALARHGRTLYLGGSFTRIGGAARRHIAALDAISGQVLEWNPDPDAPVRALLFDCGRLYVGGDFSRIGGEARNSVAELDAPTGRATAWNPDVGWYGMPGSVRALAVVGDTLYVGGDFASVGGQPRLLIAAVDATTGAVAEWNPGATGPDDHYYGNPYISALAVKGNSIYVGGHFTSIARQVRGGLAALDLETGQASPWNPDPGPWTGLWNRDVHALAVRETTIFVAGLFETIGGAPRNFVAEVNLKSGVATDWNPNANHGALALGVQSDVVYVGGAFTGLGPKWQRRMNLAALDATTGVLKEWNPNPDGLVVEALAVSHGRVYVGGWFFNIGGQERWGLAALDTLSGAATEWNPTPNSVVGTLEVVGDTLYAGGYFTTVGGAPRGHLASFDLVSGELTSWDPNASSDVYDLAVDGGTIYAAGFFLIIGGQPRRYIAALDRTTGAVTDWGPDADGAVHGIATMDDAILVGGRFANIGGQPRTGLAKLDRTTGTATGWRADVVSKRVYALEQMGDTLFVGGDFSSIGGQRRTGLAAVNTTTGAVLPWNPDPGGIVRTLVMSGSTLYAGGWFGRADGISSSGLAAFSFAPSPPEPGPVPSTVALGPIMPNPVSASATIRFALPSAGMVDLAIFDVQGRRVASLLNRQMRAAGWHEVPVRVDGWPGGFYVYRLQAGGRVATRKMVVIP